MNNIWLAQFTYTHGNNWGVGPQSAEVQTTDCLNTTVRNKSSASFYLVKIFKFFVVRAMLCHFTFAVYGVSSISKI